MKTIKLSLYLLVFFISPVYLNAAETDINYFLNSALKRNYTLKEAAASVEKAKGRKEEMWGNFFPEFSASYSKNYIDREQELSMQMPLMTPTGQVVYEDVDIKMGEKENQSADVTANMPIFTFGTISGAYDIAGKAYQIQKKMYSSKRNKVIYDVKTAFYGTLLSKEIVEVAKRQVKLTEENLNMTKELYNSGKASNLDISRVKVQLSKAEGGLIDAESKFKIAKENLFTVSRVGNVADRKIAGKLEARPFDYELDELIDIAFKNRVELNIADYSLDMKKKERWLGIAANLPKIYAYGSYKWERPDIATDRWADYWVVGARVNFPFLDGLSVFGRNKRTRASVKEARISEKKMREDIKLQVKNSFYNLKTAEKKIKVNKEKLKQARENLEVSNERYARGLLSNLELNGAILDYTNSRVGVATSVYNLLKAIEDIKLAVGVQLE